MTTILERSQSSNALKNLRHYVAVNDYGWGELANAQVALAAIDRNGGPLRLTIASTERPFDVAAEARYLVQLIDDLRSGRIEKAEGGTIVVASVDQRKDNGTETRFKNEGAPLYGIYVPEIDCLVTVADSDHSTALLADALADSGLQFHFIEVKTGEQFRGAGGFVEAANEARDHIVIHGSLTDEKYPVIDSDLARFADEVRSRPAGDVKVLTSAAHVGSDDHYTVVIADYASDQDRFELTTEGLAAVTIPANIAEGDALNAGTQLALLSLNAKTPGLYIVDLGDNTEGDLLWAAPLPNGSLLVGPSNKGVWEGIKDAGFKVYMTDHLVIDGALDAAQSLWRDMATNALVWHDAFDVTPLLDGAATNVVVHADEFGQLKIRFDDETTQLLTRARRIYLEAKASGLDVRKLLTTTFEISGTRHDATVAAGIFDAVSGQLVVAPGSSTYLRSDGSAIVFWELAVRDGDASLRFERDRSTTATGRAQSGPVVTFDTERLKRGLQLVETQLSALHLGAESPTAAIDVTSSSGASLS